MEGEVGPVDEDRFLARVRVHVEKEGRPALLLGHLFEEKGLWVETRRNRGVPSEVSIHVTPCKCATVVTNDYSIWVEHGNYLEDYLLPELPCFLSFREQKPDKAMDKPRGVGFSGMQPSDHYDRLFSLVGLAKVCDCEQRYFNSRQALSKYFLLEDLIVLGVFRLPLYIFDSLDKVDKHRVTVRDRICEPHLVLIVLKCVLKRHLEPHAPKEKIRSVTY